MARFTAKRQTSGDIFPEDSVSQVMTRLRQQNEQTLDPSYGSQTNCYQKHASQASVNDKARPNLHVAFDVSLPTLDTIVENRSILYLFDSAEKHPRVKTFYGEPNVVFIYSTAHDIKKPLRDKHLKYNKKHISQNLQVIYKRIIANQFYHKNYQTNSNSNSQFSKKGCQYVQIMFPCVSSGFGIHSQLAIKAPRTWKVLKNGICELISALCKENQIEHLNKAIKNKMEEYAHQSEVYSESLLPENQRMQQKIEFELSKKRDEWRLNAYFSYMEQKRTIKRAKEKNDEWLRSQQRKLQQQQMNDKKLAFKQQNLTHLNDAFRQQKAVEEQYNERSQQLAHRLKMLTNQMSDNAEILDKYIALEHLQNVQGNLVDSHFSEQNQNGDVLTASKQNNNFDNVLQFSTALQHEITKELNEENMIENNSIMNTNDREEQEAEFFARMNALETQLQETDKRLQLLNHGF